MANNNNGLILTRKEGEQIELSGGIVLTIRKARNGTAKVAIKAPPEIKILRSELKPSYIGEMVN